MLNEMKNAIESVHSVRVGEKKDLEGIVRVHISSFPDYFLTHLGRGVLVRYYDAYMSRSGALTVVAEGEEGIRGFIVGTPDDNRVLHSFYRRNFLYVTVCVLLKLLQMNSVIWKGLFERVLQVVTAFTSLFSDEKVNSDSDSASASASACARLLSIATLPEYRGSGCSSNLIHLFEKILRHRGVHTLSLSVNTDNIRAIHFYLKEGWLIKEQDQESITFIKQL